MAITVLPMPGSEKLQNRVNRRWLLRATLQSGLGLTCLVLASCGSPTATPSASIIPAPPQSIGGPPAGTPASWDQLLEAGRREGKVIVAGAADPDVRTRLPAAFKQRFGIDIEYLAESTKVTERMKAERDAGQYTLDVILAGSDTAYGTLLPDGWLDPLKPALILPEVTDGSLWKTGQPWFRDPAGDKVLQLFQTVGSLITLNTQFVTAKDIQTADALLDPKWKGNICAADPSATGPGTSTGAAIYVSKGQDYATQLYKGQGTVLSRDYQQLADWVGHGSYPIGLAVSYSYLQPLIDSGIRFDRPELPDLES